MKDPQTDIQARIAAAGEQALVHPASLAPPMIEPKFTWLMEELSGSRSFTPEAAAFEDTFEPILKVLFTKPA
ncbi:hypothetical protein [Sphingomonas sp. LHG3406-1]|uniref:hypothetical protein n=1 Tax=Sphingomonas sp. LHG3406-1 TaxID=2804617 RepID=UPI0026281231|nr:hypothetical protein [Sphingomonas sp. LHG3406-1]